MRIKACWARWWVWWLGGEVDEEIKLGTLWPRPFHYHCQVRPINEPKTNPSYTSRTRGLTRSVCSLYLHRDGAEGARSNAH